MRLKIYNFISKLLVFVLFLFFLAAADAQIQNNRLYNLYIQTDFSNANFQTKTLSISYNSFYPFVTLSNQTFSIVNDSTKKIFKIQLPYTNIQVAYNPTISVKDGDTVFLEIDKTQRFVLSDKNPVRYFYLKYYAAHNNSAQSQFILSTLKDTTLTFNEYLNFSNQKFLLDSRFIDSFFNKKDDNNLKLFKNNSKCAFIDVLYQYFVNHKLPLTAKEKEIFSTFVPFLDSIEPLKSVVPYYRMALDAVVKANANITADGLFTKKQFKQCFFIANQLFSKATFRVFSLNQFSKITFWYNTAYLPLVTNIRDSLLYGVYHVAKADQQAIITRYNNFENAYANILPYKNTSLINYSGKQISLSHLLKTNKPIVLNYWATWCGPCLAEMPALDSVQKVLKDKIDLYTISIDKDKKVWQNFLQQRSSMQAYSYCLDKIDKNPFLQQYQIAQVPRFMVLLANGDILSTNFPLRANHPEFVNNLNELLGRIQVYYSSINEN